MKHILYIGSIVIAAFAAASCAVDGLAVEDPFIPVGEGSENEVSGNPYWDWADKYPGVVSSSIERVHDFEVKVKGGYDPLVIDPQAPVLESTGLYVASGDYVTVEVPAGVSGLNWQIGTGYPLVDGQYRKRYTDVTAKGGLHPGENVISSYFGGFLYFWYTPGMVQDIEIPLIVSGAVQSDDFVLGETSPGLWLPVMRERADLAVSPVESLDSMAFLKWTELHSERLILTAGISEMSAMKSPEQLMRSYDRLVETCYEWKACDMERQPKLRLTTDIQIPDYGQTTVSSTAKLDYYGKYPVVFLRGDSEGTFVSEKKLVNVNFANAQTDPETAGNFLKLIYGFADAFTENWADCSYFTMPVEKMFTTYYSCRTQGIMPGNITVNFTNSVKEFNTEYSRQSSNGTYGYAFLKNDETQTLTMFMQLCQAYGWPIFIWLNTRARELAIDYGTSELEEMEYFDFLAMTASEYADRNLLPFFDKWYIPLSTGARQYIRKFSELSDDEIFWTSYDSSVFPSFEPRTPNLSFAEQRPSGLLDKRVTPVEAKEYWKFSGISRNIDTGAKITENDSDNNVNWKKLFDNDINTSARPLGELQVNKNKRKNEHHKPYFTMDFTRPVAGEEEPAAHTFNAIAFSNSKQDYMLNYIFNMQYLDEQTGEWKPTSPSEFKLYFTNGFRYYSFDEAYTARQFKFELQPICPSTGDVTICEFMDIDWIMIEEK